MQWPNDVPCLTLVLSCTCRMYAFTKLNAHSSRSHALVLLTVAKRRVIAGAGPTPSADNVSMKANVGRLYMVDLAGSERLKKSMSTGVRMLMA
jgi:Kinesin motor domain